MEPGEQGRNHIIYPSIHPSIYLSIYLRCSMDYLHLHDFGDFHGQHEHGVSCFGKDIPVPSAFFVLMVGYVEMIILINFANFAPFKRAFGKKPECLIRTFCGKIHGEPICWTGYPPCKKTAKASENGWLKYDPFLLGWPIFRCFCC